MKLVIGNKAYSSWSLRGWLACKQSGLPFDEVVVPLYDAEWEKRRQGDEFAPSSGKVPILWDGEAVVWDSLAIVDYLADKVGRDRFWPEDEAARAMARSMAAEMHSSFTALRRKHSMNIRQVFPAARPDDDDVHRRGQVDQALVEEPLVQPGLDLHVRVRRGQGLDHGGEASAVVLRGPRVAAVPGWSDPRRTLK